MKHHFTWKKHLWGKILSKSPVLKMRKSCTTLQSVAQGIEHTWRNKYDFTLSLNDFLYFYIILFPIFWQYFIKPKNRFPEGETREKSKSLWKLNSACRSLSSSESRPPSAFEHCMVSLATLIGINAHRLLPQISAF